MSLLSAAFSKCVMVQKVAVDDEYGGQTTTWSDGAEFEAAITFDSSTQSSTALSRGVSSVYTITTHRSKLLMYHDVFRRLSDNKVFRVISDGDDRFTPPSAGLDMRQVDAEEWELPNG